MTSGLFLERAALRALPGQAGESLCAADDFEIEPPTGGNLNFLNYIHSAGEEAVSGALSFMGVPAHEALRLRTHRKKLPKVRPAPRRGPRT